MNKKIVTEAHSIIVKNTTALTSIYFQKSETVKIKQQLKIIEQLEIIVILFDQFSHFFEHCIQKILLSQIKIGWIFMPIIVLFSNCDSDL